VMNPKNLVPSRSGYDLISRIDEPDKYTIVGNVNTQFGARTMTLDPKTHHVFTETADYKPAGAPTADNPRPRPQVIPNTFVLLEVGPQ